MNARQILAFRVAHKFGKRRDGVRCRCGWRPDADVKPADVAREALAHLRREKELIEQGSDQAPRQLAAGGGR